MSSRIFVPIFCLLLTALPAIAQDSPNFAEVNFATDCTDTEFHLQVSVNNYSGEPMYLTVRRAQTAPDLAGEAVYTSDVEIPSSVEDPVLFFFSDPQIGVEDIGYFEADLAWPDGTIYDTFTTQVSCTAQPYLMRGWLMTNDVFQPCTGLGLLECESVNLLYWELEQYVGSYELLEIYGWTQYLDAVDDCLVTVVAIESLGEGVACQDVVALTPMTWDSLKSCYR
jgi:hypothetical protein